MILILGLLLKTLTMSNDFYVKSVSIVNDPIFDNFNKTNDLSTELSPAIKFEGKSEVTLVDCILKNTYDIQRKDSTYKIKV